MIYRLFNVLKNVPYDLHVNNILTSKQENKLFFMQHYIFITINISRLSFVYIPANQAERTSHVWWVCTPKCAAAILTGLIFFLTPHVIKKIRKYKNNFIFSLV